MMNRILLLFALSTITHAVAADPAPILVVREMAPMGMVVGSDSAKFAIYDDGSMIYQGARPTDEIALLKRKIDDPVKVTQALLGFDPAKMEASYELTSATDQISTTIWTPAKKIEIYGNWRKPLTFGIIGNLDTKAVEERERKMWETLLKEARAFLERVERECEKEGEPWLPEKIEVMFWPYEYAPDASIIWPAGWPDLKAPTTRKWHDGESCSVFLPREKYPELRKFISTRTEKAAVLINKKKMSISYRFPFPEERQWLK